MKTPPLLAAFFAIALSSPQRVAAEAPAADAAALAHKIAASHGGADIVLPQAIELTPSSQPNLLTDGGFENVTLDASTEPAAWRTFSHTYTTDKALGKTLDEELKQHRTSEIRTGDAAEGKVFAFLKNPDEADAWRCGVKGPNFASYLTRFVAIPEHHELKRAVFSLRYQARLSATASTSYVRLALSCYDNAQDPWRGQPTRGFKQQIYRDADAWRVATLEALVPAETKSLQVLLYLDGCGGAMFDDVQLRLEEPNGPEMLLWPMSALGNEFHVTSELALISFAPRNESGNTPKNLMAVLELPEGLPSSPRAWAWPRANARARARATASPRKVCAMSCARIARATRPRTPSLAPSARPCRPATRLTSPAGQPWTLKEK